ncbi:phosphonopyruvate decarboxylase [Helicobacter equorum]|uniref:phosphonopyruvate decarboxylase n=1 Tax=Helicobacter equorum TaxID=361872 RepID=UPI000CF0E3AD|nr:phosphonopyruvate decarboxylase [Helicobacter equorum]
MLDVYAFGEILEECGFRDFSGVPCSYLSPLINYAINKRRFIMANNEGEAIAIASGITLASLESNMVLDDFSDRRNTFGVVLMQNSGLSNALSPLTSLNYPFSIPILGFVSLRGERDEFGNNTDEPQHELLGVITDKLLHTCEIEYMFLHAELSQARTQIYKALEILQTGKSCFFIVRDKTFVKIALEVNPIQDLCMNKDMRSYEALPSRIQALELIQRIATDSKSVLLATTGKCGRELYELDDRENQLYMVGSMGCVGALGLGIALKSHKKVMAVDGDSALLMRLGSLSTNAYYAKVHDAGNFCHILLDNQSHDSTGGQFNLAPFVDFCAIARACGYEVIRSVNTCTELEEVLNEFVRCKGGGAWFMYLRIAKGSKEPLGRPKITPKEVAIRLQNFLAKV